MNKHETTARPKKSWLLNAKAHALYASTSNALPGNLLLLAWAKNGMPVNLPRNLKSETTQMKVDNSKQF